MAALDFPDTPAVGDLYGGAGTVWRWDGARWASTAGASGARGVVAYKQIVATISGYVGTLTDIYGLEATFNVVPGRVYKITGAIMSQSTVAGDLAQLAIVSQASGAVVQLRHHHIGLANNNYAGHVEWVVTASVTGPVTYKLQYARGVGTGTHAVFAQPVTPAFILVEDITYEAGSGGPGGIDKMPLGLVSAPTACDLSTASTTYVTLTSQTVALVAGRRYLVDVQSVNTYITGGASGQTWGLGLHLDGVLAQEILVIDSALAGGYIPQSGYAYRFKATATKSSVLAVMVKRYTAGTMQARFTMAVLDEGANV